MSLTAGVDLPPPPPAPPAGGDGGAAGGKPACKKKRKGRSLSVYNVFFRHERARLLEHSKSGRSVKEFLPPHALSATQVREMLDRLPAPAAGGKRKHRRTHGVVSFTELNKLISDNWNSLDAKSKAPFYEITKELSKRYYEEEAAKEAAERERKLIAHINGLGASRSQIQPINTGALPIQARRSDRDAQARIEAERVPGAAASTEESVQQEARVAADKKSEVPDDKSEVESPYWARAGARDQHPRNVELAPAQQWHSVSPDAAPAAAASYDLVPAQQWQRRAVSGLERANREFPEVHRANLGHSEVQQRGSSDASSAAVASGNPAPRANEEEEGKGEEKKAAAEEELKINFDATVRVARRFLSPDRTSIEEARDFDLLRELGVKDPGKFVADFITEGARLRAAEVRRRALSGFERRADPELPEEARRANLGLSSEVQQRLGAEGAISAAVASEMPAPRRADNPEELADAQRRGADAFTAAASATGHPAPSPPHGLPQIPGGPLSLMPTPPDSLPPIPGGPLGLVPTAQGPFNLHSAGNAVRVSLSPEQIDFGPPEDSGAREPGRLVTEVAQRREGCREWGEDRDKQERGAAAASQNNAYQLAAVNDRIDRMRRELEIEKIRMEVEQLKSRTYALSMIRSRMRAERSKVAGGSAPAAAPAMPNAIRSSSGISGEESSEEMSGREKLAKRRRVASAELSDEETVAGPDLIVSS